MTANSPQEDSDAGRRGRRRRILLAVLYRQMVQNRDRPTSTSRIVQGDSDEDIESTEEPARPPLRMLSEDQALLGTAVCRFCLDTSAASSRFIAPCACAGSAEYVHIACLQQWQVESSRSICNVCTTPYSLRPPRLRHNLVEKGTLLVFSDETNGGAQSIFDKSVILMLNSSAQDLVPMGVIINKAGSCEDLGEDSLPAHTIVKRGGPVCGGRFGVIRHLVAHTTSTTITEDPPHTSTNTSTDDQEEEHASSSLYSEPVFNDGSLRFVCDGAEPAVVGSRLFQNTIRALAGEATTSNQQENHRILVFSGYCKWSKQQLKGEILRGSWKICRGSEADLLRTDNNLWQDLMNGNRLIPKTEWFEHFEENLPEA